MGTWGTDILSNDVSRDIHFDFHKRYKKGKNPLQISARMQKEFGIGYPAGPHDDDWTDLLLGFALAQWETKCLDPKVLQRVETVISEGLDIELWLAKGVDATTLKERAAALSKFLELISTERSAPRRRSLSISILKLKLKPKPKVEAFLKELVNLISPNGKMKFQVYELFENAQYVQTGSILDFGNGVKGIMHFEAQDMPVAARWIDDSHLEITYVAGIKFVKQVASTTYSGTQVFITYVAAPADDD